ncbi:hypothetical protein [Nonomuraea cavernae]|uniref:hypothetical protein n=1 Tax=Nonomuraea cavernae TaxID=2045107 RepID=UPI00366F1D93
MAANFDGAPTLSQVLFGLLAVICAGFLAAVTPPTELGSPPALSLPVKKMPRQ